MEETFYTKAIVLKRTAFREVDSKVTVYSLEKGKLDLVARGTKKILSKLAGNLEPISLVGVMVIRGKQFDYVGAINGENIFAKIKQDLDKVNIAGEIIKIFDRLVKENEPDKNLFSLLGNFFIYLESLSNEYNRIIELIFKLKFLDSLGYRPDFKNEKSKLTSDELTWLNVVFDNNDFNEIIVKRLEDKKLAKIKKIVDLKMTELLS